MDPSSHHIFSRQLTCMAGHAYPAPPQQQAPDPLGMMDPKMGPMMRALTEDDALMAQHQQQMGVPPGVYPQNSYHGGHHITSPFSPGRNPQSMSFYQQGHSIDYSTAVQGGGSYGISPTGYYQRQIPTPSPVMGGGGGLGSPNGQHSASSYPRSASAGPTIPSQVMMQGSNIYSNSYGGLSTTSPQMSHGSSPSLPPQNMRLPAGLQSPKSLPTSSPVPFSCSSPPVINTASYGQNQPSQGQLTESERQQQFAAVTKSPSQGRSFQYSPYVNPKGQPHPMSAPSKSRSIEQTDSVRSPPFVELVHSESPSPLTKSREVDLQTPSNRGDQNANQAKRTNSKGSLPKLEEMVAFLGASSMNAVHNPKDPSAVTRRDTPSMNVAHDPVNPSACSRRDTEGSGPHGHVTQRNMTQEHIGNDRSALCNNTIGNYTHQQAMGMTAATVKPSPLVILPISSEAGPQPVQESNRNHSRGTDNKMCNYSAEQMKENLGCEVTEDESRKPGYLNGGRLSTSSPLQLKQNFSQNNGQGEEEEEQQTIPLSSINQPSVDDSVDPSVDPSLQTGKQRNTVEKGLEERTDKHLTDEREVTEGRNGQTIVMERGQSLDNRVPPTACRSDSLSQTGTEMNQIDAKNLPHRTSHRDNSQNSDTSCAISDIRSGEPRDENVAKKDIKGIVTSIPNSAMISKVQGSSVLPEKENVEVLTRSNMIEIEEPCLSDVSEVEHEFCEKRVKVEEQKEETALNSRAVSDEHEGNAEKREDTINANVEESDNCVDSLAKEATVANACDNFMRHSPSIQEPPAAPNPEPERTERLNSKESKEETSGNAATLSSSDSMADASTTQAIKGTEKTAGTANVAAKEPHSVPIILANKSQQSTAKGPVKCASTPLAKGKPSSGIASCPTSTKGKGQPPVFLVAAGESKLRMNAASVVITPIRMPSASPGTTGRKRPVEEAASKSCKKRPTRKVPSSGTPNEKKLTGKATPDASSRGGLVGKTPLSDSLDGTPCTPTGDQSTLPLKKRKSRSGGSKSKVRRGEHPSMASGKRGRSTCNSEEEEALRRFRHLPTNKKGSRSKRTDSPSRGPILSVTGSMDNVLSCKVINSSDGGMANTRRVPRVLSIPSSVTPKGPTSNASTVTVHPKGKWLCSFCGKRSFFGALGELYGPYYPTGFHTDHLKNMEKSSPNRSAQAQPPVDKKMPLKSSPLPRKSGRKPLRTYPGKTKNGPTFLSISPPPRNARVVRATPGTKMGERSGGVTSPRGRAMELEREEAWVHEDCLVWSQGVFAVGGTLYGLHAAVKEAMTVICTRCQDTGATLGCRTKGCIKAFHYLCAIEVGCVLHDHNFSMTCPQHKDKKLKMREAKT